LDRIKTKEQRVQMVYSKFRELNEAKQDLSFFSEQIERDQLLVLGLEEHKCLETQNQYQHTLHQQ
jgi:hypothetical protein